MSSYTELLIERYISKGLLIDTNLLLLVAVGRYDREIIRNQSFSRLQVYSLEDFDLLSRLVSLFRTLTTTPHVLTEVSNWLGYLPSQQKIDALSLFSKVVPELAEISFPSSEIVTHPRFVYLGLTEVAIAKLASEYLVLTDDAKLIWHLNQSGLEALNINHLRQELWLLKD